MVSPETIRKVRLDRKQGISQRKIALKRGINRKTVRVILSCDEVEFSYSPRQKQNYPKLEDFKGQLEELLNSEMKLPAKQRSCYTRLHERMVELGFRGSYDSIRRYAQKWQLENQCMPSTPGCVPMSFKPGGHFNSSGLQKRQS